MQIRTILIAISFLVLGLAQAPSDSFAQVKHPFVVTTTKQGEIQSDSLAQLQSHWMAHALSVSGNVLSVSGKIDEQLLILTGPEDDMLSYRIQGLRNPTIQLRVGEEVKIRFVNTDGDMIHDLRFASLQFPITSVPAHTESVGSDGLPAEAHDRFTYQDLTLRAEMEGQYNYYCDLPGHARRGMWGKIIVAPASEAESDSMDSSEMDTGSMDGMDMGGMGDMDMGGMGDMDMGGMNMSGMEMNGMNMSGSENRMSGLLRNEPMSQEGSGTSWQPTSTPMYMLMPVMTEDWMLMLHGTFYARYNHQGGPRGANAFDGPNMAMAMLEHPVGAAGQLSLHLMMSLDPLTVGPKGYPLLLQTGESYKGEKLVDIQHPHDLFDELSVTYGENLGKHPAVFVYAAYPGEPALGPPVFMHRASAMSNPKAPLSHHWIDATHVTFGVLTAGLTFGDWKLDASYFNGHEPDEHRYDFDPLLLNSYSARLSFNPTSDLSFQISAGRLNDPENDGINVIRSTASAMYAENYSKESWWATTAIFGQNHEIGGKSLAAILLESQYNVNRWNLFGRAEYVQKTNEELNLTNSPQYIDPEQIHDVEAITLGISRNVLRITSFDFDLGVQGTLNFVPPSLAPLYTQNPFAYSIYLALHPSRD